MPPSRPTTPGSISDASSDPGSLSDLDSGWTDLSSNHSVGGRYSPSTTSDAGDSEDARSALDIYDGEAHEAWAGLTPEASELNVNEDTPFVESQSSRAAHPDPPSSQQATSDPALEDWVADALGSSLFSDNFSLELSTPHVSIRGSRALRLAFPDPLSNSEESALPSHRLSQPRSQSTEAVSEFGGSRSAQTVSSLASSLTRTVPSDRSLSVADDDASYQAQSHGNCDLPYLELSPSSRVSYALSVVLLGHPPLPHFKSMTVLTLMDMVAFVFKGYPVIPEGSSSASMYEVSIHAREREACDVEVDVSPTRHILMSDHTSGSSSFVNVDAPDCPTVALVFIQPPLSPPSIPSLPANTLYLPLLLPSVSDGFASSLLNLSPSVLFDHSVPNISTPGDQSSRSFALQQCVEMNIIDKRLDGTRDVVRLDEFIELPADWLSTALEELLSSAAEKSREVSEQEGSSVRTTETQYRFTALHKQNLIISAFIVALLFGSTVLLRGTFSNARLSSQTAPNPQGQRLWTWPFYNPFSNVAPSEVPITPPPSPALPDLLTRSRALTAASLKSLAVSVFRPEAAPQSAAGPSAVTVPSLDKDKVSERSDSTGSAVGERPCIRIALLDAAVRPLTLDGPWSKSLPMLPPARSSSSMGRGKGKGKEKAMDVFLQSPTPFPSPFNSLSTRVSHALSPLIEAVNHDLRELQEAIDALLRALLQLQGVASQGLGDVVQELSKQAEQGMQELASKVYILASRRHARARHNARKVRDVGERYVSAAKHVLGAGYERARGNVKEVFHEGLAMRKIASRARRQVREESRKLKRQAKEHRQTARKEAMAKRVECKQKRIRDAGCLFQSVVAYVA